jgi:hypothetical protein
MVRDRPEGHDQRRTEMVRAKVDEGNVTAPDPGTGPVLPTSDAAPSAIGADGIMTTTIGDPPVVAAARTITSTPDIRAGASVSPPGNPSFDFDPKTKSPNLAKGEVVLVNGSRYGVALFVTNFGRKVFACSLSEYEKHFGSLPYARSLFEQWYPNAR